MLMLLLILRSAYLCKALSLYPNVSSSATGNNVSSTQRSLQNACDVHAAAPWAPDVQVCLHNLNVLVKDFGNLFIEDFFKKCHCFVSYLHYCSDCMHVGHTCCRCNNSTAQLCLYILMNFVAFTVYC